MRRFSFYIILVICSLLFITGTQYTVCRSRSGSFCSYDGNELVLLWNRPADNTVRDDFLSHFPDCRILETYDNYMLISVPDSSLVSDTLIKLRNFSGITAADPNYPLELSSALTEEPFELRPEDFSFYSLQNLVTGLEYYHNNITPAREVIIAVADTGIDILHPLLTDYIWTNPDEIPGDGIDNDANGYTDDINGWDFYHDASDVCNYEAGGDNDNHGTHVAGIITSVLRGGNLFHTDAAEVPVKIMPLKIHGGEKASGSVANAIKAIKYAVMMDADICNISWGTSSITSSVTTLEQTIREADMLFVSAAGNTGSDNDQTPVYPASFRMDNVISVTFVNSFGLLTTKSNYGLESVDIAAPGTDIYSTVVGDFAYMSGSSMAVPYVSAVAALLCTTQDGLSPAAVRELLLSTACPLPYSESFPLPELMSFAKGKLITPAIPDLLRLLDTHSTLLPDTDAPALTAASDYTKDFIRLNIVADDADGSGIRVIKYAAGTKSAHAFRNGTVGNAVNDGSLRFAKPGTYTIYASDYAGNETVLHLSVEDDTTAPQILPSVHTSPSGSLYRLIAHICDAESQVTAVYLTEGEYNTENYPLDAAQELTLRNNRIYLPLETPGYYTLYAKDIRGNTSTAVLFFPVAEETQSENKENELD